MTAMVQEGEGEREEHREANKQCERIANACECILMDDAGELYTVTVTAIVTGL